ncbi:DUF3015 family protein [Fluviispira sanaruensis]|uniref:Orotate phosphoribosyltransferase n=1 Tax=Fluviispira sanaruensis TaxID=2493639 RepID=A0A4P2VRY6_FLUSA|nr:DUF3015 family protein [Fluviispira sanaruensis]BBH51995.1 orotate phosphoribosyltransferase [Fluviispira sanaruensis]
MKYFKLVRNSFIGLILMTALPSNVYAAVEIGKDGNYKDVEAWGMGGCGFASLFIKEKETLPQIGASLVNEVISGYTQSSAITSGTSNCVESRSKTASVEQEVFITVNLSSLSKEAAQGTGEHLIALANVFGCPNEQFSKFSQMNYNKIYETNEPNTVLQNYLREVNSDQFMAKNCVRTIY